MANVEKLHRVVRWMTEHPERVDMGTWFRGPRIQERMRADSEGTPIPRTEEHAVVEDTTPECGTTACLAGWAVALEGWRPILRYWDTYVTEMAASPDADLALIDGFGDYAGEGEPVGTVRTFASAAQEILELTDREANSLFYLDDLDTVVEWVEDRYPMAGVS